MCCQIKNIKIYFWLGDISLLTCLSQALLQSKFFSSYIKVPLKYLIYIKKKQLGNDIKEH